ncbi:hypothetical protein [Streptomyces sp. CBMA156]|uniref:hypothetical protein n=1 Tax=Streptomyces sp. CBMA156 TaxID=1930280 RepID=UPI001661BA6A|nr:hypothetical protein [Streptomyces sp. CBMA156]MBD0670061.1 hypothetical protein [Streptomyces sp. CBMA156]
MLPIPDHLATALRDRDPLRRYRAVADAIDAVTGYLDTMQADAARDLIAAHGGNASAAGRELGFGTAQAFKQWLGRRGAGELVAAAAGHAQEQPALFFRDPDDAQAALEDYHLEREEIDARLEPLVLGALAAGLTPETVYRVAAVPLETVNRLRPAKIGVAADLETPEAMDVLEETGRALTAHARALAARSDAGPETEAAARIWRNAAAAFVAHLAPTALWEQESPRVRELREAYQQEIATYRDTLRQAHPDLTDDQLHELMQQATPPAALAAAEEAFVAAQEEQSAGRPDDDDVTPTHHSADIWLAAQVSECNRLAAGSEHPDRRPQDDRDARFQDGMAGAWRGLAAAYTHLRATATVPPLPALQETP